MVLRYVQHQRSLGTLKLVGLKAPVSILKRLALTMTRPIQIRPRIHLLLLFASSLLQGSELLAQQMEMSS